MKKLLFSIFLIPLITQASPYVYTGEFQSITSNGTLCNNIFNDQKFKTQHFITGPTHLTSVIHFKSENNAGLLNNASLIGNNDGWGRLRVERDIIQNGITYRVIADGMYDREFILLDVVAEAFNDVNAPALCKATAQFSAY